MAANIIHTGGDGKLEDQEPKDVEDILGKLANSERVVFHFHGGLVNRAAGTATAERVDPVYRAANAEPAFFVWESGLMETIGNNLPEIANERIFKILVKRLLKHVAGKLLATAGDKAAGQLPYPRDIEVATELQTAAVKEPFDDIAAPGGLDETTDAERQELEEELKADGDFQTEAQNIARTALPHTEETTTGSKGVVTTTRRSTRTLMSPEVVKELESDTEGGSKGLISTAALIFRVGKILVKVIRRFRRHRDHGVYPTVVEEILRELYVANVGAEVWHQMKKDTADTFVAGATAKGGCLVLDGLGKHLADGKRPRITLVGHSTGAVFILNMLKDIAARQADGRWPADAPIENVIFLAPACSAALMHEALVRPGGLAKNFRMFAMSDERESANALIKGIYTRSLLYFVSGVVEREGNGESAFDLPIVGMQRYVSSPDHYAELEVRAVRDFLAGDDKRVVWAVDDRGPGLRSNSISHGGFDDNDPADPDKNTTMASVQYLIANGA